MSFSDVVFRDLGFLTAVDAALRDPGLQTQERVREVLRLAGEYRRIDKEIIHGTMTMSPEKFQKMIVTYQEKTNGQLEQRTAKEAPQ